MARTIKYNLTNCIFGKWSVIKYIGKSNWLCQCKCGTQRNISCWHLLSGDANNCRQCTVIDLIGKKFGKYTVIGREETGRHKKWICRCDCGTIKHILGYCLTNGQQTKCIKCKHNGMVPGYESNDMAALKFKDWTVIKKSHKAGKKGEIKWECRCKCGNIQQVLGSLLRKGASTMCKKCGVLKKRKPSGVSAFNGVFSSYKRQAKKRGLEWGLSEAQFREITQSNCYYTGLPPSNIYRTVNTGEYIYSGIDRVENEVGYLPENCVPCCGAVNLMKRSMRYSDFINTCILVANTFKLKQVQQEGNFQNKLKAV